MTPDAATPLAARLQGPIIPVMPAFADDREADAVALVRDIEQPLWAALAQHGHWAALHEALRLQGWFASRHVRFPLHPLEASVAADVARTLEAHGLLG